jgi:hypothetical protein
VKSRAERIEVWPEFGGLWRWRYRATDDHTEIASNRSFDTLQNAVAAARLAYPDVPIEAPPRPDQPDPRDLLRWVLYGAAAILVVAAVVLALRALVRRTRDQAARAAGASSSSSTRDSSTSPWRIAMSRSSSSRATSRTGRIVTPAWKRSKTRGSM